MNEIRTRRVRTVAAALVAFALSAAPAYADTGADDFTGETVDVAVTTQTVETCTDPEVAPLLSQFGDDELYFPAPGGAFEGGVQGWQLDGGASVDAGSSELGALGFGQHSLRIPVGGAATSPAFCVDERFPKFRMTVGQTGEDKVKLKVYVVYPDLEKNVRHAKDIDATPKHRWKLSDDIDLKPNHGRKVNGWRLVALKLAVEKGDPGQDVRVDDIVVDPRMRG